MIGEPELSYQVLPCQRQRRRAYCLFNYVCQDGLEMFHFPEQQNLMLLRKRGNNNYLYIHDKKKEKLKKERIKTGKGTNMTLRPKRSLPRSLRLRPTHEGCPPMRGAHPWGGPTHEGCPPKGNGRLNHIQEKSTCSEKNLICQDSHLPCEPQFTINCH